MMAHSTKKERTLNIEEQGLPFFELISLECSLTYGDAKSILFHLLDLTFIRNFLLYSFTNL